MNIMAMLGLAVGIDYSLFIVSRFREERARGVDKIEAIAPPGATSRSHRVISGMTVALALAGLLIMPDSSNQAIGAGAFLVVLAAVMTIADPAPRRAELARRPRSTPSHSVPATRARTGDRIRAGFWELDDCAPCCAARLSAWCSRLGLLLAAPSARSSICVRAKSASRHCLPDDVQTRVRHAPGRIWVRAGSAGAGRHRRADRVSRPSRTPSRTRNQPRLRSRLRGCSRSRHLSRTTI